MNAKASRPRSAAPSFTLDDFASALEQHDYQFQKDQMVRGRVFEHSGNGAFVDVGAKSPAFLPLQEAALNAVRDMAALEALLPLQTETDFVIIREQNNDGQITLSRRRLEVKQLWEHLAKLQAEDQILTVRVKNLNKGGVLVNVEGLRGFIPRSHLNERENLEQLVGQVLSAKLLQVDPENNKLVLSQKLLVQATNVGQFEVGQVVEGKVASIKPFGLFVTLDQDTTGLLHIKQISQKFIASLSDLFKVGDPLKAVVLEIDEQKGRISLSTRVLEKHPGEMLDSPATLMAEAEDRASKLKGKLTDPV